jgi:hypothetical protein
MSHELKSLSEEKGGDEVKQGAILRAILLWGFFIRRDN